MRLTFALATLTAALAAATAADETPSAPATRPEMKKALEAQKKARPRLPLPPLSDEEKAGGRRLVNNGRMRRFYLPADLRGGNFVRRPDPVMTLDYPFKTMLFWIVSRANDCRYCMGHQERKLAVAGLAEDRIAGLDGDWTEYTAAEQSAFALARRLTHRPHTFTDATLEPLHKHYKDLQILEMVVTIANYNAINRWTGALNITQEDDGSFFARDKDKRPEVLRTFLTPTADRHKKVVSRTAPGCRTATLLHRPALESRATVAAELAACRTRKPRLPLATEAATRALLPVDGPKGPLPQWVRLLANFPVAGKARIAGLYAAQDKGTLDRRLRAQVAWIAAREDRAWYALGHARKRLTALRVSEEDQFALDGGGARFSPAERAAFALARKLTATPDKVDDADVARVRKHFSDQQVAELIYHITLAAFFDRLTEAAGLPLEE